MTDTEQLCLGMLKRIKDLEFENGFLKTVNARLAKEADDVGKKVDPKQIRAEKLAKTVLSYVLEREHQTAAILSKDLLALLGTFPEVDGRFFE